MHTGEQMLAEVCGISLLMFPRQAGLAELEDKERGVRRLKKEVCRNEWWPLCDICGKLRFSSFPLLSRTSSGFWESQDLPGIMSTDFGGNYSAQTKPFFSSSMTQKASFVQLCINHVLQPRELSFPQSML